MLRLKYKDYLNRVYGGWIGKCIGGAIGAQQEGNKSLMDYTMENVFPETIPPNDDLDLQILWLQEVLEKRGSSFSSSDLADVFARYNLCMANEYTVAIKNIELGIEPPWSGLFNNSFFKNSMGCPIRSEIWGFICPGNPDTAVRYAELDGRIDHDTESINGEKFFAAMEADVFFEKDIHRLIQNGLKYVPENTELWRCIHFVIQYFSKGTGWTETRQKLVQKFGSGDGSYSVINAGITVMALLYGQGDITNTMLIAVNSGYDTDCTAATAGAIIGQILGADNIPEFWKEKIGKEVIVGMVDIIRHSNSIIDLAKDTCAAGLSLLRDGVISLELEEIPDTVKPSLPLPVSEIPLQITVDYYDLPSIGAKKPASVTVGILNNSGQDIDGILIINPPAYLFSSISEVKMHLKAGCRMPITVEFNVRREVFQLPQKNIIDISFRNADMLMANKCFGLSGAACMKVIGPFWDNYDTTVHREYPYGNKRQLSPDGWLGLDTKAMLNSFVNIDRPYIDETFANIDGLEGEYAEFPEDRLRFDGIINYKGPYCIYLVHDFSCPEDRNEVYLHIGNSGPYKFWLNGELVSSGNDFTTWTPYNRFTKNIVLKAGLNRAVIKLASTGASPDFSYLMSSESFGNHWFVDMSSRTAY